MPIANHTLNNAVIFITGGTGSWGKELVTQILKKYKPKEIRIYSRGEPKQVEMRRKFKSPVMNFIIGDVRDKDRLLLVTKNVDYIFHLAALKHVPICEENPWETVLTNIYGTQNLITAAVENNVKKVVDISTDKAVDPFNLYGVTKACGEKLMIGANLLQSRTKFICVRGGNVLGTDGSVVPLFKTQIMAKNQLTLTDPRMTRFLFSTQDAIKLVLDATLRSVGGEVFVMKMPSCHITDLAQVMIARLGNSKTKIKQIGIRQGEKLYEVLVSKYEVSRTYSMDKYYVVLPQIHIASTEKYYKKLKLKPLKIDEYSSLNTHIMSAPEIDRLLDNDEWFK